MTYPLTCLAIVGLGLVALTGDLVAVALVCAVALLAVTALRREARHD